MFQHEHLWLHVVAHVVMVVMPVILLVIVVRWIFLTCAWLSSHVSVSTPFANGNNTYSLPSSLSGFIFSCSGNAQVGLALLSLSTLPLAYLLLELPKRIINGAISAEPAGMFNWEMGAPLDKIDYLLILCAFYLAALMASSVLKYALNNKMGITAERLLRRIIWS